MLIKKNLTLHQAIQDILVEVLKEFEIEAKSEFLNIDTIVKDKNNNIINFNEAVNNFRDTFRETFKELVKQKLEGKEIRIVVNENKDIANDLVEQLKKSIELMKDKKEMVKDGC